MDLVVARGGTVLASGTDPLQHSSSFSLSVTTSVSSLHVDVMRTETTGNPT